MYLLKINIFIIYANVLNADRSVSIETSHKKNFFHFIGPHNQSASIEN